MRLYANAMRRFSAQVHASQVHSCHAPARRPCLGPPAGTGSCYGRSDGGLENAILAFQPPLVPDGDAPRTQESHPSTPEGLGTHNRHPFRNSEIYMLF